MPSFRNPTRRFRPRPPRALPPVSAGSVLAQPSFTSGWATFAVPLAQGDLPSGQSLKVAGLSTQTDVVTTWGDNSAKVAIVTCKPSGTGSLDVTVGTPAGGSFAPTVPTASVAFTVYTRFTLLGDFSITSGTCNVVLRNIQGGGSTFAADAVLIEELDGSGNPTGTNYVVDNSDGSPAYVESGTWGNGGSGYKSALNHGWGLSERTSTDNSATATWKKTGLASGTYRISASWSYSPTEQSFGSSSSRKVGYEVKDDTTSRGEIPVSQVWDSGEVGGTTLGDFSITSGTCNVRLGNDVATSGQYVFGERVALYKDGALVAIQGYNDSGVSLSGFSATTGYAAIGDANSSDTSYFCLGSTGGTSYVQFQFTGLASGTYRIVVWQIWGNSPGTVAGGLCGISLAADAPWTVLDNVTSRGTVDVSQKVWSGRQKSVTYTATLSGSVGTDTWLDGALCKEWRRIQSPVDGGSTAHPALLVSWDVRCFDDGTCRLQLGVENTYQRARVKEVYYDVAVTVNGSSVFTATSQEHFVATRWTQIFFAAGYSESTVTPDFSRAYSSSAKLLPKYANTVGLFDYTYTGLPSGGNARWNILRCGGITQYNMYTGDVSYVGPFPMWISSFLVNNDSASREYMLATARNSVAAYPVHYRATDDTVYDPETNSNFWPDPRNSSTYTMVDFGAYARPQLWRAFLSGDMSHHPQATLIPFLLTGERYLADEMAFWNGFEIVAAGGARLGAQMILQGVEARAMGWSLRTVSQGAAFLPDAHPAKAWSTTCVENTVQWHDDYAAGSVQWYEQSEYLPTSPVAYVPFTAGDVSDIDCGLSPRISANWQNSYVLYGIQLARDLGLVSSSLAANAVNRLTAFSMGVFYGQQAVGSETDPSLSTWPRSANVMKLITQGFAAVCTDDANYFKNWTVQVGTAGTTVVVGTRNESYGQLGCLKLVSDGSTLSSVYQEFNKANSDLANAGGTTGTLSSSLSYYLVTWMKISATDSTGTVVFEIVDNSGNVHNSNQFTLNVSTLTTSYARVVYTITAGGSLPGTYRLRIRFGSSPTSGRAVFLGPISVYRVPGGSSSTSVNGTQFYTTVGFILSGTKTYFTTWDGLYAGAISTGQRGSFPYPSNNNFAEHLMVLNIAERLGISNATTAYDNCAGDVNFSNRDNFEFVRGFYV